jgi:hypothetical protein
MQCFLGLFISVNCSTCVSRSIRPSSGAQNCTYSVRYCQTNTAACCYHGWDGTRFHLIHDSSSIGLTIPDTVCAVLCSWWWADWPPDTRGAIYRNKQIEKTLHLVGCTSGVSLWCMDIWTSNSNRFYDLFLMLFHATNFLFQSWPHLVTEKMRVWLLCDVTFSFRVSSTFKMSWTTSTANTLTTVRPLFSAVAQWGTQTSLEVMSYFQRIEQCVYHQWEITRFHLYHRHLFL